MTDATPFPDELTPPETDLKVGQIHVCTFADGSRILARGDMLMIWRDGSVATMTPEQWVNLAIDGVPLL